MRYYRHLKSRIVKRRQSRYTFQGKMLIVRRSQKAVAKMACAILLKERYFNWKKQVMGGLSLAMLLSRHIRSSIRHILDHPESYCFRDYHEPKRRDEIKYD